MASLQTPYAPDLSAAGCRHDDVHGFVYRIALEHEVHRSRRLARAEFGAGYVDKPLDATPEPVEQGQS